MEFQPEGKINLHLQSHNEDYVWNKVTSCIHNILGQERWVDLYGECVISCQQSGLTARIQFVKVSFQPIRAQHCSCSPITGELLV